jgi:hypothetical protein
MKSDKEHLMRPNFITLSSLIPQIRTLAKLLLAAVRPARSYLYFVSKMTDLIFHDIEEHNRAVWEYQKRA